MKNKSLHINIKDIHIGKRVRHYAGDIKPLMESLDRVGLLQPVVIDSRYNLLAGFRRLTAARLLGWKTIDAVMISVKDKKTKFLIELDENITRLDFTPDQLEQAKQRLNRLSKNGVVWKFVNWLIG